MLTFLVVPYFSGGGGDFDHWIPLAALFDWFGIPSRC